MSDLEERDLGRGDLIEKVIWKTDYQDPYRFQTLEDFKSLTLEALRQGSSDLFIQPGLPVCVEINGDLRALTHRAIDDSEAIEMLVLAAGRDTAQTDIVGGVPVNERYELFDPEIKNSRGDRLRHKFRVNASPILFSGHTSCQIVMRAIPKDPPLYSDIGLTEELVRKACPENGIVYVAGGTGSGKTTTFASILRFILEDDTPIRGNLITHEEPIEFTFDSIQSKHSIIVQSQVPTHFADFYAANREAMRRKPGLIMIGEMREEATIRAAVEAAMTGHPCFGTVHANDVSAVVRRLISRFPEIERATAIYDIIDSARFIMAQKLVKAENGGRCAVREYIEFDEEVREELAQLSDMGRVTVAIRDLMKIKGWSFAKDAERLLRQGLISEQTAHQLGA